MLVKYNGKNVRTMVVNVKLPKTNAVTQKGFKLKPGINKVDDDLWKDVKKNNTARDLLESGALEEMGGKKDDGSEGGPTTAKELIAIVDETIDIGLLESMLAEHGDKATVARAINKKRDDLKS